MRISDWSSDVCSSDLLSVLIALILTPALCATILRPKGQSHVWTGPLGSRFGRFFDWFNRTFDRNVARYGATVEKVERHWGRTMLVYALIVFGMGLIFLRLPGGFLPDEDQGVIKIGRASCRERVCQYV